MGEQGVAETTLDLDRIMDAGMAKFQGELIEAAREGTDVGGQRSEVGELMTEDGRQGAITPGTGEQGSPPEGQESGVGGQASEVGGQKTDDGGPKTDGEAAGAREGKTPEGEKPQFRFKDHEAAEDGYRHLQAATTKAQQEAARLRAELKAAQEADERQKAQEKLDQDLTTFIAEQHESALAKIDTLDPDDANYRKQVAMAWAEKDAAVKRWERAQGSGLGNQGSGVGGQESGVGSQGSDGGDQGAVWAVVEQRAQTAGIDPSDDYFRMICTQAPNQGPDGKALPFDDQVKWAVDQTLAYHKKQEQRFQERLKADARKRAEQDQEASLPIGRSAADRNAGKAPPPKMVSLDDALKAALEERRL